MAVWPFGRAGTADPSGWILGPELMWPRQLSDRPGVPTNEDAWPGRALPPFNRPAPSASRWLRPCS
eukprot:12249692-Alexandrium_andersonii.AAC.1